MRRVPRLHRQAPTLASIALVAIAVGFAGATPKETRSGWPWRTADAVGTRIDSEIARYYLHMYLSGHRLNPRWDLLLDQWSSLSPAQLLEPGALKSIAEESGSVDLAASIFATRLAESPLRSRFESQFLDEQTGEAKLGSRYTVAFVPGWLYLSHGETTGADFAAPRALLTLHRIDHVLVATHENASIEENARTIEETLGNLIDQGRELIVVSTSKGGPEVALALASMGEATSGVAAWLNIGGLLRGTALADEAVEAPRKWFVNTLLWWKGWRKDGLLSLTTQAASSRGPEDIALPGHLLVVNLVAVPLSGDVSKRARDGYRSLRAEGPNDGLTLLADAIWPRGETIVIPGTDHFFSGVEVDRLTVAVLRTIEEAIEERTLAARRARQPCVFNLTENQSLASRAPKSRD